MTTNTNKAKAFTRSNIGRTVEHVRTGVTAEFLGRSALDENVINILDEDGREVAADAADWDLVY